MSSSVPSCDDQAKRILDNYVLPITTVAAAVSVVPLFYLYIDAYMKKKLRSSSVLFWCGVAFFTTVIVYYVCLALYDATKCDDTSSLSHLFLIPSVYVYPAQCGLIASILFMRLVGIFMDSAFEVSKATTIGFVTLLIFYELSALIGSTLLIFTPEVQPAIGVLLVVFSWLLYIFIVLWLNGLFVFKLYSVYASAENVTTGGSDWTNLITKTALLCFTSTSQIVLFLVSFMTLGQSNMPIAIFVNRLVLIADLHTDFLSIFLSYQYFDPLYRTVCGACHRRYKSCWINWVGRRNRQLLARKQEASSGDEPQIVSNHSVEI